MLSSSTTLPTLHMFIHREALQTPPFGVSWRLQNTGIIIYYIITLYILYKYIYYNYIKSWTTGNPFNIQPLSPLPSPEVEMWDERYNPLLLCLVPLARNHTLRCYTNSHLINIREHIFIIFSSLGSFCQKQKTWNMYLTTNDNRTTWLENYQLYWFFKEPVLLFLKTFSLFIYLFLAGLGLHCCTWAFSSCGKWELLSSCGVQAPH